MQAGRAPLTDQLPEMDNLPLHRFDSDYLDLKYPGLQVGKSLWQGCRIYISSMSRAW